MPIRSIVIPILPEKERNLVTDGGQWTVQQDRDRFAVGAKGFLVGYGLLGMTEV